jgi:hypothetical protein
MASPHYQEQTIMEIVEPRQANLWFHANKLLLLALILVVMIGAGLYTYQASRGYQARPDPLAGEVISQQTLNEKYGLGVNLIAVTGAGGMVDLRLRIINAEKAKALLGDSGNFPALRAGNGVVLRASEDSFAQAIQFKNGGSIFILYANAQSSIKPGDPVTIVFGDLQVESIPAN